MKTFKDLVFKDHRYLAGAKQAIIEFDSNFAMSIIFGNNCLGTKEAPYEVAIFDRNGKMIKHSNSDDLVIGYLTESDVTRYMKLYQ